MCSHTCPLDMECITHKFASTTTEVATTTCDMSFLTTGIDNFIWIGSLFFFILVVGGWMFYLGKKI